LIVAFSVSVYAQCQDNNGDDICCYPGTCAPPNTTYSRVMNVPSREQWAYSGGFCGALSIQSIALSYGIWISQLNIRQAAPDGGGHGNPDDGYEILHTNIADCLSNLSLVYKEWPWQTISQPQSTTYLSWLKKELTFGRPVVWFIMCSGDNHNTYGLAAYDHIEPVFGIYSNHVLGDPKVYADDVLVHGSDWDLFRYYRPFNTLVDSASDGPVLTGNCSNAQTESGGPNEAYPCVMNLIDYGWSILGPVDPLKKLISTSLAISGDGGNEPQYNASLTGTVTVNGPLKIGTTYITFRWEGSEYFPTNSEFMNSDYLYKWNFIANTTTYSFVDPNPIYSESAVYYGTIAAPTKFKENTKN